MAIDENDLRDAAATIGKALAGSDLGADYDRNNGHYMNVAGGLFAIADAIKELTEVLQEKKEE